MCVIYCNIYHIDKYMCYILQYISRKHNACYILQYITHKHNVCYILHSVFK